MDAFFNWLNNPGYFEEILLTLILVFVLGLLGFIIFLIIKSSKEIHFGKTVLKFDFNKANKENKEDEKENENIKNKSKDPIVNNEDNKKKQVHLEIDYDLYTISYLLDLFFYQMKEEMMHYCEKNGLDKKSFEEYKMYIDEKKGIYLRDLHKFFTDKYLYHNSISKDDLDDLINRNKEATFQYIEQMFTSIRSISINEHKLINEKKDLNLDKLNNRIRKYIELAKEGKSDQSLLTYDEILSDFIEDYEKLIISERNDILYKQMEKIKVVIGILKSMYEESLKSILEDKETN